MSCATGFSRHVEVTYAAVNHMWWCLAYLKLWLSVPMVSSSWLVWHPAPTGNGYIYKGMGFRRECREGGSGQHGPPGCFGRQPHLWQDDVYTGGCQQPVCPPDTVNTGGWYETLPRVGQTYVNDGGMVQDAWGVWGWTSTSHTWLYINIYTFTGFTDLFSPVC